MIKNKKGQLWNVVVLVGGLIGLVLICVGIMLGWGALKSATDVIIPEFNSIGQVTDNINISEYTEKTLTPTSSIIDNIGLIIGMIYILGILGLMTFAFIARNNMNGWLIAFFLASVLLLIAACIFASNAYEDFHNNNDEIGLILQSATLASFLIIYSPEIMTMVAFIAGIILFTGNREEQYYV